MARRIATAFCAYGLFAVVFLAINMPPFQNPDEFGHFARAVQVARLGLIGHRYPVTEESGKQTITAGGKIDPAALWAMQPFEGLKFHSAATVTRNMLATEVHWSDSRVMLSFPATANYSPFFYVPSAIGIVAGRAAGITVADTLILSRLLTGAAAVAIGTVAVAGAGASAIWIFALLTLPMALSLMASSSQDALILAFSGLAGAISARSLGREGVRFSSLAWMVVSLALISMSRPPYGALALLPLGLPRVRWRWRLMMAAIIAACTVVWSGIAAAAAMTNYGAFVGADPAAQVAHLWSDPWSVSGLASRTLAEAGPLITSFIGILGWLDTPLPETYYSAAKWMIALAAVAAAVGTSGLPATRLSRLPIGVGVLIAFVGIFAISYLNWSKPGAETVDGVQGRYFIPLGLAGAGLIPALGRTHLVVLHRPLVVAVVAFPLVSLAVTMRAVILRYYLGVP